MLIPSGQSPGKVQFASCGPVGGVLLRSGLSSLKSEETSPQLSPDPLKESRPRMCSVKAGRSTPSLPGPGLCTLLPRHL